MIQLRGSTLQDEQGRTLLLRGINLGGSSKVPAVPDGATHLLEGFFDHRQVSFVGRPFPLSEADEHFRRLKRWGFTFLRFLVTWEAVEHAGPGQYDQDYLDYLRALLLRAGEYGFLVWIDPHQDAWSRFTGGDGAPGWTLEAAGMHVERLVPTGAAIVHNQYQGPFPPMLWPSNYGRLGCAALFTLFFGGDDFAPNVLVEGEPVQAYLQRHYIAAMRQVALRLRDLPHVVGYGTLNEPAAGFIGLRSLSRPFGALLRGPMPSPLQAMALASGIPQRVPVYALGMTGFRSAGARLLNPTRLSLWRAGYDCPWRAAGIWDLDRRGRPVALLPDFFAARGGRPVDFARDYLRPFINRFAAGIRDAHPGALIFAEGTPEEGLPEWGDEDAPGIVNAPHWYDGMTLVTKRYNPWLGVDPRTRRLIVGDNKVRLGFAAQLAYLKQVSRQRVNAPVVIGEFGIPFDMNNRAAYRSGDFRPQAQALDVSFQAMEANLLHAVLWNYTSDNDNRRGDRWNGEDLSIFSRDQQQDPSDIDSGGRALEAAVRPYPAATAGEPLRMRYDYRRRVFEFEFRHDPAVTSPTEVFVPEVHYPHGYSVQVSDGTYEIDRPNQRLLYHPGPRDEIHVIRIEPAGG